MLLQSNFTPFYDSDVHNHNPLVLGSIFREVEKYSFEVWEVFWTALGSIDIEPKYSVPQGPMSEQNRSLTAAKSVIKPKSNRSKKQKLNRSRNRSQNLSNNPDPEPQKKAKTEAKPQQIAQAETEEQQKAWSNRIKNRSCFVGRCRLLVCIGTLTLELRDLGNSHIRVRWQHYNIDFHIFKLPMGYIIHV